MESQQVPPHEFARRLRDTEARLIDCLRHLGPNQGVIGYTAGRELKRMPSEIYWGGLGSWRVRRFDYSLAEYARRASAFGRLRDRDDDGNVTVPAAAMWSEMPEPPGDFLDSEISFELRESEAQLLAEHIRQQHPGSLLAAMSTSPELAGDADLPWDLDTSGFSEQLQTALRHAQCFSELTVGPQHLYNLLLARKARDEFGWDTEALEAERNREARNMGKAGFGTTNGS